MSIRFSLAFACALLLLVACVARQERGPAVLLNASGPQAERVQTQVGIVDAKLAAVEHLCTTEDGQVQDRCLAPLHDLKRKRAYYRQRTFALTKTANTGSLDDVTKWKELEIEVEMLTVEVDSFADELRHAS